MQSVFTTFPSSRFVDRQAVVDVLRTLAQRIKADEPRIAAVHLFGSFATGTAGPRSDADVVIETPWQDADLVGECWWPPTGSFRKPRFPWMSSSSLPTASVRGREPVERW